MGSVPVLWGILQGTSLLGGVYVKANEFIGDTMESKRHRRAKVDAWLGQVQEVVQQARMDYPELSGQVLSDVKLSRTSTESRVTLVFCKKGGQ